MTNGQYQLVRATQLGNITCLGEQIGIARGQFHFSRVKKVCILHSHKCNDCMILLTWVIKQGYSEVRG